MINNTAFSDEELLVQSLDTMRIYWQQEYSSYDEFMDELAAEIDPSDPNLSQELQDLGVFRHLYESNSVEEIADDVSKGTGILAQGAAGAIEAAIPQTGGVLRHVNPIPSASNPYIKGADIVVNISKPANVAVPSGVMDIAKNVAAGAAVLGAIPGITNFAASGYDPNIGAKEGTAYGAGVAAAYAGAALAGGILGALGIAGAPIIAAGIGAVLGVLAANAVLDNWDTITDHLANAGLDAAEAAGVIAASMGSVLDSLGQIATDAINNAIANAGDLFDGFMNEAHDLNGWIDSVADYYGLSFFFGSPLVLDLDSDGIELISQENSTVMWDIDEDGFSEASGWIAADDGFLAIDLDSSGDINSHAELFGSITVDGFSVLANYDTNTDGVIDSNDTQFGDLLVWQDVNSNGISESGELFTLADLDIVSIDLNASTPSGLTNEGHSISHVSSYTVDDGVNGPQTFDIVDVWFNYDNTNTDYIGEYTLDLNDLFNVNLRGYGDLPDMHISASLDKDTSDPESLMSLVNDFTAQKFSDVFVDNRSVMDDVQKIMFRWAGVDTLDPSSRGQWVDARKLEFLEKLIGQDYLQGTSPDPGTLAAEAVHRAFESALYPITARLTSQVISTELFNEGVFYNYVVDSFEGFTGFNQDGLDALLAKSLDGSQVQDKMTFWLNVVNVIDSSIGIVNLPAAELTALENTITASDDTLTIQQLLDKRTKNIEDELTGTPAGDSISGTTGDDVYTGSIGDDTYLGNYGNDTLSGGIGHDTLYGAAGNDILDGQLGNDALIGQGGADTYLYTIAHGDDYILEQHSDIDKIVFSAGLTSGDILISRIAGSDLYVQVDPGVGAGSITIDGYVELLEFSDSTVIDIRTLDLVTNGTSGADTLYGAKTGIGGSGVDTIYGHDGDDIIYGSAAGGEADYNANYLDGGAGNDTLYGRYGNDTYVMGSGNDIAAENGRGDDTYIYTSGLDTVTEYTTAASSDKLVIDVAETINDITFTRSGYDVTVVIESGVDEVFLDNVMYNWRYNIETVEFGDGFSTNLLTFESWQYGTSSADTLNGTSSADTIIGKDGNDVIDGLAGDDDIHGGAGNDTLYGGDGLDHLWGGTGADTSVFESASAFNDVDVIGDFNLAEGDIIDISDVLSGYNSATDAITDFVQITDNGVDSTLSVDADGGADNFIQVATLLNVTGLTDEEALETSGNLIAA